MLSQLGASKSRARYNKYTCSAVNVSEQIEINSRSVNETKPQGYTGEEFGCGLGGREKKNKKQKLRLSETELLKKWPNDRLNRHGLIWRGSTNYLCCWSFCSICMYETCIFLKRNSAASKVQLAGGKDWYRHRARHPIRPHTAYWHLSLHAVSVLRKTCLHSNMLIRIYLLSWN